MREHIPLQVDTRRNLPANSPQGPRPFGCSLAFRNKVMLLALMRLHASLLSKHIRIAGTSDSNAVSPAQPLLATCRQII